MYNSLPSSKFVRLATIAATGAFLAGGVLSYVHAHGGHLAKEELSKRLAKEQAEADADAEVDSGQRTNNVYYLNSCRWERYGGTLNGGSFYQCPSTKVPVSVSYTTQDYWEHYVGAVHSGIGWKEGSDQDYQGSFISGGPGGSHGTEVHGYPITSYSSPYSAYQFDITSRSRGGSHHAPHSGMYDGSMAGGGHASHGKVINVLCCDY